MATSRLPRDFETSRLWRCSTGDALSVSLSTRASSQRGVLGICRRYSRGAVHDRTGLYDFFVRRAVNKKSRTETTPPLPSPLVRFLLSINQRLTLEDISYGPAGLRGAFRLLFLGNSRGRGAANVLSKVLVMSLMTIRR
jgi:hypothetical protein